MIFARRAHSCRAWPKPLHFAQPLPRLRSVSVIGVTNCRFRERLAERRHPFLPFLLAYHRQTVDVAEMMHRKLRVFPQRAGRPAVETCHVKQDAQFSVLPDESLEFGHKVFVICFDQLSADVYDENLPAVFFIELNGRIGFLSFDSG